MNATATWSWGGRAGTPELWQPFFGGLLFRLRNTRLVMVRPKEAEPRDHDDADELYEDEDIIVLLYDSGEFVAAGKLGCCVRRNQREH